jgi:hypothetical protein
MVNFKDPTVILNDICAHPVEPDLGVRIPDELVSQQWHSRASTLSRRASTCAFAFAVSTSRSHVKPIPLIVGSSSQPSTTSSVLSEGVALIGRRYGWAFLALSSRTLRSWIELQLEQIYSFTRFAALVMVSLNLVFFNTRTPINCQVGGLIRLHHRSHNLISFYPSSGS